MARIRSIKPEMRTSLVVAEWPRDVRYLFALLWGYLDDHGYGVDDARLVKADCLPLDDDVTAATVDDWMWIIARSGPLCRYVSGGKRYMHATSWSEHQKPQHPKPSKIPRCPHHDLGQPPPPPETPSDQQRSSPPEDVMKSSGSPHEDLTPEQVVGEGEGEGVPPTAGALAPRRAEPGDDRPHPAERPPDPPPQTTDALIGEWLDHCRKRPPGTVIGQVGKQIKAMLAEGIDPADVRAGLAAWWRKGIHPSALPSVVNELMNAAHASSGVARASPRPSTTDQRVGAALALANRLREAER